jgi:hypothetical protein
MTSHHAESFRKSRNTRYSSSINSVSMPKTSRYMDATATLKRLSAGFELSKSRK